MNRSYEDLTEYWQKQCDFAQRVLNCDRARALEVVNQFIDGALNGTPGDWFGEPDEPVKAIEV